LAFCVLDMNKINNLAITGLGLILVTAFALASIAAYQSIIGLADLFAARAPVVIAMAIAIEFAKLLFAGAIHMFWHTLPMWKWIGVGIIAVHMAVTNIGIWSYLSTGYTLQEAPVAAIERQIENLDNRMDEYKTLETEALRGITAMDTAYQELVEKRFVTRAERYERENAEKRAALELQRDEARIELRKLNLARDTLEEEVVDNAAKLGSIEHISAFTDGDKDNILAIVAWFTVLLMLGLDPAAILMVILFTFLLSKKIRDDNVSSDPIEGLDEDTKAAVAHLNEIGYLKNRKKKT
jgi:hypothetical protein